MSPAEQSLSKNPQTVNTELSHPSLVNIPHNGAWDRQQRRCFQRLNSFCLEAQGRGCQLFRVDLTTSGDGDSSKLRKHFQELRRRVERVYRVNLEAFIVETREGNGVLHMVWAIKSERAVFIHQAWLSEQWLNIHGAKIVYIKRMGRSGRDVKRVSRYFSAQYLAGQSEIVRISWSWWRARIPIAKAWNTFKGELRQYSDISTWAGLNPSTLTVSRHRLFEAWEQLLTVGSCTVGNLIFFMSGRSLDIGVI